MNEEALREILEQTKKEAKFTRIIAIIMAAMLCILLICVLIIVPRIVGVLRSVDAALTQAQQIMTQANAAIGEVRSALDGVDEMTGSIKRLGDETLKGISEVDFEKLSQAISDLQAAVEPLARFSRALSGGR